MSKQARKFIDENSYSVEFVTSYNSRNEAFFAFLLIPAIYAGAFKNRLKTKSVDLRQFGVVLASGLGHQPSEAVKQQILSAFPHAVL